MEPKTAAGMRLREHFGKNIYGLDVDGLDPFELDYDEVAAVALNTHKLEAEADELEKRLAAAFRAELTMFQGDDETWLRIARSVIARAGIITNISVQDSKMFYLEDQP